MKRISALVSLLMVAALLLAACASAAKNNKTESGELGGSTPSSNDVPLSGTIVPGSGVSTGNGTPGATTGTPSAGKGAPGATTGTPGASTGAPGPATGTPSAGTQTVAAMPTQTPSAGNGTPTPTDTPQPTLAAVVPVTGGQQCIANRVQKLFDLDVQDANGKKIGSVTAVIVFRDAEATLLSAGNVPANGSGGNAPFSNGTSETPFPTLTPFPLTQNTWPRITYLAVAFDDLPSGGNTQSGNTSSTSGSTSPNGVNITSNEGGTNPGANNTTSNATNPNDVNGSQNPKTTNGASMTNLFAIEANGKIRLVPYEAFKGLSTGKSSGNSASNCALTMTVPVTVAAQAPVVNLDNVMDMTWTTELRAFWQQNGLPNTGNTSNNSSGSGAGNTGGAGSSGGSAGTGTPTAAPTTSGSGAGGTGGAGNTGGTGGTGGAGSSTGGKGGSSSTGNSSGTGGSGSSGGAGSSTGSGTTGSTKGNASNSNANGSTGASSGTGSSGASSGQTSGTGASTPQSSANNQPNGTPGGSLNTPAQTGSPVILKKGFQALDARDANGDKIGSVKDFIFDPQTGNIAYAVMEAGGVLGIGAHYIPIPVTHAAWVDDGPGSVGNIVIDQNTDVLSKAPAFTSDDQINASASGWDSKVVAFWNQYRPGK